MLSMSPWMSPTSELGWSTSTTKEPTEVWAPARGSSVGGVGGLQRGDPFLERERCARRARHPHLVDVEGREDLAELADMVGMGVGDGHHVDAGHAQRLELGHHVIGVVTTGVDEHGGVGSDQNAGVALADVEKVHLELPGRRAPGRRGSARRLAPLPADHGGDGAGLSGVVSERGTARQHDERGDEHTGGHGWCDRRLGREWLGRGLFKARSISWICALARSERDSIGVEMDQ
jgi:hypothetical protein